MHWHTMGPLCAFSLPRICSVSQVNHIMIEPVVGVNQRTISHIIMHAAFPSLGACQISNVEMLARMGSYIFVANIGVMRYVYSMIAQMFLPAQPNLGNTPSIFRDIARVCLRPFLE